MTSRKNLLDLFRSRTGRTNHVSQAREPRIEELCGFTPSYLPNTRVRGEIEKNGLGVRSTQDIDGWMHRHERGERRRLRGL
jgi:hypothetical protein